MIATAESYSTEIVATIPDKPFDRISWGAIFAGAFSALSIQLILSLIGIGIGLSTIDPQTADNPTGGAIGIGAVVWWVVSSLISLFIGGMIAGRIAGTFNGYLHGHVTWALVTVATVLLLGTALGSAFRGVTGLAQFTSQQLPQIQQQMPGAMQNLQAQTQDAATRAQAAANDPATQQRARETSQRAAKGGAMGTIGAAIALILGAGAAGIGGKTGRQIFLKHAGVDTTTGVHPHSTR